MLGEHVERARPRCRRVLRPFGRGFERRLALDHLDGGDKQRLARLVESVIGPADALGEPARTLGRADIDDEIDIAPVDAEIERRGRDHGAEPPLHHRRLDLPPLAHVERTVMERDRKVIVVVAPQLMEQHLGLRARIDEDEREPMRLDRLVDLGERIAGRMPGPGKLGVRLKNGNVRPRSLAPDHDLGKPGRFPSPVRHEKGGKLVGPRHCGRQSDGGERRRERPEPGEVEREQVAALARSKRVQLIEDNEIEPPEEIGGASVRQHQRDLLRRGKQNVGREHALAGAARGRRVAGPRFEPDE